MRHKYEKPNIVVSRCLGFSNCRYNGQTIFDDFVNKLKDYVNFITPCPEYDIGLGAPRHPIRIVRIDNEIKLLQPATSKDFSNQMNDFSDSYLSELKNNNEIDGFILKFKSPSCGINNVKIYANLEKGSSFGKTQGFFAKKVIDYFPSYPLEDEGRLKNFRIRENFLSKIFCLSSFRKIKQISQLVDFHAKNKFLLMTYSEQKMRQLGKIVASYKENFKIIKEQYYDILLQTLNTDPKKTQIINVLMHIAGFFSKTNTADEKLFFKESLLLYREGRIPLTSIVYVLKTWALNNKNEYILNQTLLEPYPSDLLELKDSGKTLDI